jgi:hypothetical protein
VRQARSNAQVKSAPGPSEPQGVRLNDEMQPPVPASVAAAPRTRTPLELKQIIETERLAIPFLLWRDVTGEQVIFRLDELTRATIGRREGNTIAIRDDREISRVHADLEHVGGDWTIADDGLSSNGTFVNRIRITQRRRLRDRDVIRVGRTIIEYRSPAEGSTVATSAGSTLPIVENLTDVQRRILVALCRPYRGDARHAAPATNNDIAREVLLGVDAVKNHLRVLFQRFDISELPQNQKRARLVECAFRWGLVSEHDL